MVTFPGLPKQTWRVAMLLVLVQCADRGRGEANDTDTTITTTPHPKPSKFDENIEDTIPVDIGENGTLIPDYGAKHKDRVGTIVLTKDEAAEDPPPLPAHVRTDYDSVTRKKISRGKKKSLTPEENPSKNSKTIPEEEENGRTKTSKSVPDLLEDNSRTKNSKSVPSPNQEEKNRTKTTKTTLRPDENTRSKSSKFITDREENGRSKISKTPIDQDAATRLQKTIADQEEDSPPKNSADSVDKLIRDVEGDYGTRIEKRKPSNKTTTVSVSATVLKRSKRPKRSPLPVQFYDELPYRRMQRRYVRFPIPDLGAGAFRPARPFYQDNLVPRSPRLVFRDPVEPGTLQAPFFGPTGNLQDLSAPEDNRGCGVSVVKQQGAQRRIVGGDEAGFGSFPWQAYIRIGSSRCGGTLVNKFHVVTAGHCVARASARQVQVTLGDYVINSAVEPLPAYTFGVRKISVHPYFKFTPQADRFDVAVLRLDRPVQYMPHIAPICLPDKGEDFLGQFGWAAGWGALQAGSRLRPKTLQAVNVPIIDNRLCERWHRSNGINVVIYDEMMCAGYRGGGKDSCQGDSGGPLMMEKGTRWFLIGIVSAGYSCAQRGQPGIYHRVAHTVDWISYIINS